MFAVTKTYKLAVGSMIISVESDIRSLHDYIVSHYEHCILDNETGLFSDYQISVNRGPFMRKLYKPQAVFKFNHSAPFKPLPLSQAHALLEWGMNWVISGNANQFLIIHAAALEKNGKGIIISAPSGSGKSTLCAYLVSQGWRLLSDELALVSPESLLMHGLARPINLKNRSIELMKPYFDDGDFSPLATDTHKGTISLVKPPKSSTINSAIPVMPSHLVFVNYQEDENCYLESVDKCLALTEIIKNSFNFGLLNKKGFDCARRLVDTTDALYIEYNNFQACEQALLNAITEEYTCDKAC